MIVTDLQYGLEKRLVQKLDIMIERCTANHPKRDAVLINEGGEGEGKTNTSLCEGYYAKWKTKRELYLFFRLKALIKFAKSTEEKIMIWDEPSLDSLATDHYKEINKDLTRLLMTVRKKRHFLIINMTKFWKFNEYIVVDRNLGMVCMYSRGGVQIGRFRYVRKKFLQALYNAYRTSKKRLYNKLSSFGGTFPDIMEKHFDKMGITVVGINGTFHHNASYATYEAEKDKAILSIGEKEEDDKAKQELINLKYKISQVKFPVQTKEEFAKSIGISIRSLQMWAKNYQKAAYKATPQENEGEWTHDISTNGIRKEELEDE